MTAAAKQPIPLTRADLEAVSPTLKAEILDGVLHTHPRPRMRHMRVSTRLAGALDDTFDRARSGPGGWWIVLEPGIELPSAPEVSPDVAGWRRERVPVIDADEPIAIVPDWVCEVLSPSNEAYDRKVKFPFYARTGVAHLWVIDPRRRTLEVRRLLDGRWLEIAVHGDDEKVRAEPFEAVEIELADLWMP